MKNYIYLVGMMGAGKTTLGRQLAQIMDYPFVDLDTLIEEREGLLVREVFSEKGEAYFREAEAQTLRLVPAQYQQAVVATGGGAPCFHGNMAYMNATGCTVFLEVPVGELVRRLRAFDMRERPLLEGKTPDELATHLQGLLGKREHVYHQAHLVFDTANGQAADLQKMLLRRS